MPKFIVCVQEIIYGEVSVNAKNAREARKIVQKELDDGIYPELDDSLGVEITKVTKS
jgi:hypothetical protein